MKIIYLLRLLIIVWAFILANVPITNAQTNTILVETINPGQSYKFTNKGTSIQTLSRDNWSIPIDYAVYRSDGSLDTYSHDSANAYSNPGSVTIDPGGYQLQLPHQWLYILEVTITVNISLLV